MSKKIKLLFTSVGRRIELIQSFRQAAEHLGIDCVIYGADITDTAPALMFCNRKEIVCRISNPNYIDEIKGICEREKIDAVIPTIDTDLLLLANNKEKIESVGTKVFISAPDKIALCRDKRFTADYFIKCGLKSPVPVDNVDDYNSGYPCFIKPKDGSSSINAYKVENHDDLIAYSRQVEDYIIQRFISGTEYTVDIFCDFDGNPIYITPRERVAVRGGEVLKTKIFQDDKIIEECRALIKDYKPCGALTVQLIRETQTGDDYYIEINPRFGGGAPLSMKAGANSAEALLKLLCGEKVTEQEKAASNGAIYSRFDNCVCIEQGEKHKLKAVIFDLDDTLYSEKEYVKSGFKKVAETIGNDVVATEKQLWQAFENGENAIDSVLRANNLYTEDLKNKCVNEYRNQIPDIHLFDGVVEVLTTLKQKGIKTGIITDGRPFGQRAKLKALGLENLVDEIIITDELGGINFRKPDDISFRIMQKRFNVNFGEIMYLGDNLNKDFIAPLQLGMQVGCFENKDGLYYNEDLNPGNIRKISKIAEVLSL